MNSEHVRDDIAGAEIFENVSDMNRRRIFGPALADVDQERDLQTIAKLSRPRQRLQALCSQGAAGGHDLDTDDDVPISLHGLFDFVLVDEARIGEDAVAWPGYPAQSGEIDVVQHPRLGVSRDVIAKHREETMARASRIHDRRNAGTDAKNIGVHAEDAETIH